MGERLSLPLYGVLLMRSLVAVVLLTAPPNLPLKGETSLRYLFFVSFFGVLP
jgi:hypothetical protein